MNQQKAKNTYKLSFQTSPSEIRNPVSRDVSWMPDQVRHDELGTFCEFLKYLLTKIHHSTFSLRYFAI